jgi:hypothetical protein
MALLRLVSDNYLSSTVRIKRLDIVWKKKEVAAWQLMPERDPANGGQPLYNKW